MLIDNVSHVQQSNLLTMGIASKNDARQIIPYGYTVPPAIIRVLRAQLILEEALESCAALGVLVRARKCPGGQCDNYIRKGSLVFSPSNIPETQLNLADIIDGCCDTIYVATGTLTACGAPDYPHMAEVCRRNDAKFPNGIGIIDENGKYQKPEGWTPPDHDTIIAETHCDLLSASREIICQVERTGKY